MAANVGFAWTVRRFGRLIFSGKPKDMSDRPGQRLGSVMAYFFGQKKVVEKATIPAARAQRLVTAIGSRYHFLIFWGFIVITIGSAETLIQGLFPSFSLAVILGDTVARALWAMMDVANVLVLALIGFAVFRRVVLRPRLIPMSRGRGHPRRHRHVDGHAPGPARSCAAWRRARPEPGFPMSALLGQALAGVPAGAASVGSEVLWWLHVVTVLAFLNYLLYSKHSHIIAALPNIYFLQPGPAGRCFARS